MFRREHVSSQNNKLSTYFLGDRVAAKEGKIVKTYKNITEPLCLVTVFVFP